ncbi:C40 family peptidase [Actinomadura kijaniata]|uniref:Cell wall-associated NlpC family hydrolase n=1 Tax=Actinomadura namibiensis TaxID=182080 RepID=A0A7W3M055_ACTNM|nr:NlpC/P60 family protein [Actinomadura namibiensis]MBA8957398.1 cell wall-associated NlpC family hydrolase [Actinomadura namibiensis]
MSRPRRPARRAEQEPSTDQLRARAEKLGGRCNGLKVQLEQAQHAARSADATARRREQALRAAREEVKRLAATSYMSGGQDPMVSLFASGDPQSVLDQTSAMRFFTRQSSDRAQALLQTLQSAQRARKTAEERAAQVRQLRSDLERQRKKTQRLYERVRGTLLKRAPEKTGDLPPVSGSGRAAQSVRFALRQIGIPYSWGGGGPNGRTYGVAQGRNTRDFDCSGLTLYAYVQVGVMLPRYTGAQWKAGVQVPHGRLRPGDPVSFHADLHHMGLYVGDGKMAHAPQAGDHVKISPIAGRPWAGAVRVA